MPTLVKKDCAKNPNKFYGAPCLPTSVGVLWECDSKQEYLALRAAYEESEGNCNTCKHLERVKHEKDPQGWLPGICRKIGAQNTIRFHPDDPTQLPCWESRRTSTPTT